MSDIGDKMIKYYNKQHKNQPLTFSESYLVNQIADMLDENEQLKAQLKDAEDVIGFYADEYGTWSGHSISGSDLEITINNRPSGGKRARDYQSKHKDTK